MIYHDIIKICQGPGFQRKNLQMFDDDGNQLRSSFHDQAGSWLTSCVAIR